MFFFLYLLICFNAICAADDQATDNQIDKTIDSILASAQIPESMQLAQTDDNEPFISDNTFTLSPMAPTAYEQQKMALREQFRQSLPEQEDAVKQYKEMKKQWSVKSSIRPGLSMDEMDFLQLTQRKNELILEGDYRLAIKYLERGLKIAENAEQRIFVMLELAELLMRTQQYAKAEKLFNEFIQLYPGNEFVEQAFVKTIQCSWQQTSRFDRDQTKTEETLALIERFEQRQAICSASNIAAVAEIKQLCDQKLAESNIYVAHHYIGRKAFRSAGKRIDGIRSKDLCKVPHIEPELLHLEIQLAQAEKNIETAEKKCKELFAKYPDHEITLALAPKIQFTEQPVFIAQAAVESKTA